MNTCSKFQQLHETYLYNFDYTVLHNILDYLVSGKPQKGFKTHIKRLLVRNTQYIKLKISESNKADMSDSY